MVKETRKKAEEGRQEGQRRMKRRPKNKGGMLQVERKVKEGRKQS